MGPSPCYDATDATHHEGGRVNRKELHLDIRIHLGQCEPHDGPGIDTNDVRDGRESWRSKSALWLALT